MNLYHFTLSTSRENLFNITSMVNDALCASKVKSGAAIIFCPHTTAGITINENADPDVKHDVLAKLSSLIPQDEPFYQHCEGNSAAHLKAILTGFSLTLPIRNGRLSLGTWQGVYFCEYDGPRTRKVQLLFQRAEE